MSAPEYVAQWLVQASGYGKPSSISYAEALTSATLARVGAPISYVSPPPDLMPDKRALPKMKGGYKDEVVTSIRSNTFHHPDCRTIRAFVPENLSTFASPQDAWDEGL